MPYGTACPICSSTRGVTCRPLRHLCAEGSPYDETVRDRQEEGGHREHTERFSRPGLAVGIRCLWSGRRLIHSSSRRIQDRRKAGVSRVPYQSVPELSDAPGIGPPGHVPRLSGRQRRRGQQLYRSDIHRQEREDEHDDAAEQPDVGQGRRSLAARRSAQLRYAGRPVHPVAGELALSTRVVKTMRRPEGNGADHVIE